ncbi:ATP-binding cassette domain-containing protein [Streptomyces sp. NPDC007901]|uniref:ATP-binding cassette domain-containing protein n=1 Tax=Streptomyces sp. NPDC007901 TaxID=3364785 RepID=UPI0036E1D286
MDEPGMNDDALLSVSDLRVAYPVRGWRSRPVEVLKGVSLNIRPGETLGLVGESGSGKTTVGRAVLGLAPVTGGSIRLGGVELTTLSMKERRRTAQNVQVVFQDPYSSLNPSMTIEEILTEPLLRQGRETGRDRVRRLLDRVGLPADAGQRLAREFSGGQRQRIAIARALALRPGLIVCDEPTSALDLSTQTTVLDLFLEIQQDTACAYLFITHDLAVVRRMSHRVAVLLHGEIVEEGDADQVCDRPQHPYTQRLQLAAPVADPVRQRERRLARQPVRQ